MGYDFSSLNTFQLDVLKEVTNIGSGNAVTALAKMLGKKICMDVPKIRIMNFSEVTEILGSAEIPVVGVMFTMSGDITGNMMFMLNCKDAASLIEIVMGKELEDGHNFDDIELSCIKEIGNILVGSYTCALSQLLNLKIIPSIPYVAIDMVGAIISVPAIEFGKTGDSVLYIETQFQEGNKLVSGDFFLVPDVKSYEVLLKTLGV